MFEVVLSGDMRNKLYDIPLLVAHRRLPRLVTTQHFGLIYNESVLGRSQFNKPVSYVHQKSIGRILLYVWEIDSVPGRSIYRMGEYQELLSLWVFIKATLCVIIF